MRNAMLAAALVAALTGSAAHGQVGATSGTPMQPGGWGARGWQAGAAAPVTSPAVSAESPAPAASHAPRANYAAPPVAAAPGYDGYEPLYSGYSAHVPRPRGARPIVAGKKLPGGYADPIYTVTDWRGYGLEQPYPGTRWVRYFDDAVLADARGRAIAVRRVAWDAPRRRRPAYAPAPVQPGWTPPVASLHTERHGDTVVTTEVIPPPRGTYPGGYGPDYGWGPGVTVTPSIVTTTTTTVTEQAPRATPRRRARRR